MGNLDNVRVFLWAGFGMLLFLTFQAWQTDNVSTVVEPTVPAEVAAGETPKTRSSEFPALPSLPDASSSSPASSTPEIAESTEVIREPVRVITDVFELEIDRRGGDIRMASLSQYPLKKDAPDIPVTLLTTDPDDLFVFRTGLRAANDQPEPNHLAEYQTAQTEYRLADDADELFVTLQWQGSAGLAAEKIYRFKRGSYNIELEHVVTNDTANPYEAVSYLQLQRRHNPLERSMFNVDSYSFTGPVLYNGEKYDKLDPDDLVEEPIATSVTGGWVASIQHHFLAAAIPPSNGIENYNATYDGQTYLLSAVDNEFTTIPAGQSASFPGQLFIGPKLQSQLNETADGLALTVDYGLLTLLAQPLFWVLQKVYNFIGNWGWTIIIVTFLIKLVFYKLTEASGRSMAKMRKLQPRLKALQERYKDDREAMSRSLMELYKREKVNPAAGCLPMLIQIPFFIAFYWVLLESVEMRQAPFALWITDLSTRDPYFVLPLLMGAAMFFQQKLNPAPPDPIQAKVMQFLPVMFTVFFAFFPAGLVLYWLTNSILSILQQWRINKMLGAD
jgi:YidC/Oxa1 family membrane protein insertase